jgi:multiple sugar transport system permease protein
VTTPGAPAAPSPDLAENPVVFSARLSTAVANGLLALLGVVFLLPMLWLALASVDSNASWSIEIPHLTLANYGVAISDNVQALVNSALLSTAATAIATAAATLAAYALSRRHIPLKTPVLLAVLFLSGIPLSIIVIPVYEAYATLGWLSLGPCAVFLSVTLLPFEIYLIKNFIDAVPRDLEEAAEIEQASLLQVLRRVVLPLCLPGIAAAAILGFVSAWGSFLVPLVLIASPNDAPASITMFAYVGASRVEYGHIAAFSVVYSLPVFVLYTLSARLFRGGFLLGGAVRG